MSSARWERACPTPAAALAPVVGLALCATLALGGCGSSDRPQLRVSAAASLRAAFRRYAAAFPSARVSYSFAGSDALAAQIEQGARPDVFASANLKLPDGLHARGLVETPVEFAANTLVLAVPRDSAIRTLAAAERPGLRIAVGSATVPVGAYTETVLRRLPRAARRTLMADIADREPDVSGIVAKLSEGAVDVGFVYATDVAAAHGALRAVAIPAGLQPRVGYAAAVVRGSEHAAQARAFVAGLLGADGRRDLRAAGFLAPGRG